MKGSKKFLFGAMLVTIIMTIICAAVCYVGLAGIKEESFRSQLGLVAAVREKYPELSDKEIIDSFSSTTNTAEAEKMLRSYSITENDWLALPNEGNAAALIINTAALCLLTGGIVFVILLFYDRRQKRLTAELTDYLSRLNSGKYDMDISSNGEDSFSRLKNEIYRTTVRLREQSERSRQDKINLKNSISDISHQIKTPLTSISVMLDRISEDSNMPKGIKRKLLTDVKHSSNYIISLVQSLLTLSRFDADSITMKQENVSVGELLGICIDRTEILAELGEVKVNVQDCENIILKCDKKWMSEAITNILKNCIEHTPPGGIVDVSALQNKLFREIIINDNGRGIPADELTHIFERFYKGSGSDENSIGIGLSLAKTIIEKNNGYISVKSKVAEGSCFTIKVFHSV